MYDCLLAPSKETLQPGSTLSVHDIYLRKKAFGLSPIPSTGGSIFRSVDIQLSYRHHHDTTIIMSISATYTASLTIPRTYYFILSLQNLAVIFQGQMADTECSRFVDEMCLKWTGRELFSIVQHVSALLNVGSCTMLRDLDGYLWPEMYDLRGQVKCQATDFPLVRRKLSPLSPSLSIIKHLLNRTVIVAFEHNSFRPDGTNLSLATIIISSVPIKGHHFIHQLGKSDPIAENWTIILDFPWNIVESCLTRWRKRNYVAENQKSC